MRAFMPHHTKWVKLFENLRYIVIDEIHTYRGVFGSHLCQRAPAAGSGICEFYGSSSPVYLLLQRHHSRTPKSWPQSS